jgi:hypothetical protein
MRDASILEILGLEHNEKFVQALIALQRHAKESQKKTSTAELLAALNKVVTAKSRFPRWKTDLEPIEKELLQLVEATRRIARMPAQAIKINPLESSSNSNSSLCMEKQNAVPKLQFETMGPISEIEMVDASLGVLGWSSWLEFLAGVLGWSSWLEFLVGVLGWSSWLEFLELACRVVLHKPTSFSLLLPQLLLSRSLLPQLLLFLSLPISTAAIPQSVMCLHRHTVMISLSRPL